MTDLWERVAEASPHVAPRWTAERERTARVRFEQSLKRRLLSRYVPVVAGVVALAVVFAWQRASEQHGHGVRPTQGVAVGTVAKGLDAPGEAVQTLADGSRIETLLPESETEVVSESATEVVVRVKRGAARFDVTPRKRQFRVLAGPFSVTVLGTVFTVKADGAHVTVAVERGKVRVSHAGGSVDLVAGQAQTFAPENEAEPPPPPLEPIAVPSAPAEPEPAPPASGASLPGPGWRSFASEGLAFSAYEELARTGEWSSLDDPDDLMLAAEVARANGDALHARALLERMVERHASDPRAQAAAVSLGRLLLYRLGEPERAAGVLAIAYALSPAGALAEEALAREVVALTRSGADVRARERARLYMKRFPTGWLRALVELHVRDAGAVEPETPETSLQR